MTTSSGGANVGDIDKTFKTSLNFVFYLEEYKVSLDCYLLNNYYIIR